ncbi:hypothetical protein BE15_05160 [Sorangium cellulosum]|uniref:Uncharacterized protein n=1 Tax=Sorangium cellulosum TaxID=56 RepID=A0A150R3X4_SORCE|nr:hypothetical protein BE15_05160 [Sorangium cellulosum]
MMDKDDRIIRLLGSLDLQRRGWSIVDHWEGDTCAIGIARASELRRLVYVSTFDKECDKYDYECELASGPAATDYATTGRGEGVTYDELLEVLIKHLG